MSKEESFIDKDIAKKHLEKNFPYFSEYTQEMQNHYINIFVYNMKKSTKTKDLYLNLMVGIATGAIIIIGIINIII